jgi:hypothetical protein
MSKTGGAQRNSLLVSQLSKNGLKGFGLQGSFKETNMKIENGGSATSREKQDIPPRMFSTLISSCCSRRVIDASPRISEQPIPTRVVHLY